MTSASSAIFFHISGIRATSGFAAGHCCIVYRIGLLPSPLESARIWREIALREGVGDLYLCAAKTYETGNPTRYGFDAIVEFPPHGVMIAPNNRPYDIINPEFRGAIYDYRQLVVSHLLNPDPGYQVHPTVMPGWDNTARRRDLANIFVHSTPEFYEVWLREIVARVVERNVPEERTSLRQRLERMGGRRPSGTRSPLWAPVSAGHTARHPGRAGRRQAVREILGAQGRTRAPASQMISVVICSVTPEKYKAVCASYARCLAGTPHEIVGVHDARSLM